MTILQIITLSDLGGAQTVVANLANHLSSSHDVVVVAGEGDGKFWNILNPTVKKISLPFLGRRISLIKDLKALCTFIRLCNKYKPDIIHLHSSKVGVLGRIAFPKSKVIYTVHGFDSIRIAYRQFLPIEKVLQRRCKYIIGVSKYDVSNLRKEGVSNNVNVIYNGIIKPQVLGFNPFEGIKKFSYIILCIARISPQKNCDLFIKIASLLPQYAFVWIGNQDVVKKEYGSNVFFMGSLTNAGAYNEYADLFILPSNYEGLPMTVIEAMSFGKPVVASNVGGISEIVVNGENGYVVENTPNAFVEKIEYILENRGVYASFSRKALGRFENDLTVDKMADGYLNIYNA